MPIYKIDLDRHAEVGPSRNLSIGSYILFGISQMTSLRSRSANGTVAVGG